MKSKHMKILTESISKNKRINGLSAVVMLALVITSGSYVVFATKPDTQVKKQRLEQLKAEYSDKQRAAEKEILAMPRNSEEDLEKVREAENKLKEMTMTAEADKLISELAPSGDNKLKVDLETRIFYSRDTLTTENYKDIASNENDPVANE